MSVGCGLMKLFFRYWWQPVLHFGHAYAGLKEQSGSSLICMIHMICMQFVNCIPGSAWRYVTTLSSRLSHQLWLGTQGPTSLKSPLELHMRLVRCLWTGDLILRLNSGQQSREGVDVLSSFCAWISSHTLFCVFQTRKLGWKEDLTHI